jgi:hypothetical protein
MSLYVKTVDTAMAAMQAITTKQVVSKQKLRTISAWWHLLHIISFQKSSPASHVMTSSSLHEITLRKNNKITRPGTTQSITPSVSGNKVLLENTRKKRTKAVALSPNFRDIPPCSAG